MSNARNISKLGSLAAHVANLIGLSNNKASIDAKVQETALPAGTILDFAGTAAPSGFLFAAGQVVSRTTYAALFAALGTAYNTGGEAATDFRLPDLRGRVVAGVDNMGGTAASRLTSGGSGINGSAIGSAGGAQTVTLTAAQIPAHSHTATTNSTGGHSHGGITDSYQYTDTTGSGYGNPASYSTGPGSANFIGHDYTASGAWARILSTSATRTTDTQGAHSHTVTVANNTGGDGAHTNTQPTIVLNKIIKT